MHDGHRIRINCKLLCSVGLNPHTNKILVVLLQSFTRYHCLTEVLLVAKVCHRGLQESVAERCTLSVYQYQNSQMLHTLPIVASLKDSIDRNRSGLCIISYRVNDPASHVLRRFFRKHPFRS
ncbi:hypothetical protein MXB_5675 [Myxobolus squamalis]|nr:hypothetical protein MXB_5675 [Myxobolus squamalis]